ncbi:metalloregulator ArsR/SmtB family transcription factor [Sphingomonas sp.]|uniref:ArsR/SmtB family transcription factor n=1 Tax=Sphingomonas sp. TaxID=28214 RepID=UPI000DB763EE|nr:metalloregulator ArsR/SmtB family transcription factor [Sphingomonas sp.]PZU09828.1 MAG: transcriptional regulator [Sphingomonas sp.]
MSDLEASAELLKALAHATRLAILIALADSERSVGDLEKVSGIGQPALSQQLAVLRNAALVETRREAKLIFYRINHARLADVSALLDGLAGTVAVSRDDALTLRRVRAAGSAMFAKIG